MDGAGHMRPALKYRPRSLPIAIQIHAKVRDIMHKKPVRMDCVLRVSFLGLFFIGTILLQGLLPHSMTGLKGILSQVNVAISVYLAVRMARVGYRAALLLNTLQLVFVAFAFVIVQRNDRALPGMVIPLITIIIVTIIKSSHENLEKQIDENFRQHRILEEQAAALQKLANYDALTNALNLDPLLKKVEAACEAAKSSARSVALVFIDIDNFKHINDTMGHSVGDAVLASVASRLLEHIHWEDALGRIGGDEFALLVTREISKADLFQYLSALTGRFHHIRLRKDVYSDIQVSMGVAFCPAHASAASELLHLADVAMYNAKSAGKARVVFFEPAMQEQMDRTIRIEQNLLVALDRKEFYLHYQPQYRADDKKMIGLEALLRWNSRELGFVGPDAFIPIAERTGLIFSLGNWVLRQACMDFMRVKDRFPDDVCVSVNISPIQFINTNFVRDLKEILDETGMIASSLILEMTETALLSESEQMTRLFREVRSMGVQFALDDFGKGYSSLHYLLHMPFDMLKIDRSFITDLVTESANRLLISAVIQFSQNSGLKVVAEGVETEEQLALLKELKCDYIQGYLWGKPMPIDALPIQR